MKKFFITTALLSMLGCATVDQGVLRRDTINDLENPGEKISMVIFNYSDSAISTAIYKFSVVKYQFQNKTTRFAIKVELIASSWKFLDGIKIKADGQLYSIPYSNPDRIVGGSIVYEYIYPEITEEMLNQMANSKALYFQLTGKYQMEPVAIPPESIALIKDFQTQTSTGQ